MLTGDNGIIKQATQAKQKTSEAQEKEGVQLAVTSSKMEDVSTLEITEDNLNTALRTQFGENVSFSVTNNEDGSFSIRFNDTDRMYYVENSGNIIENNNILKISTAEELKTFRDDVNNGNTYEGKYVYLANDIMLDKSETWVPIGLYPMDTTGPTDEEHNRPFKGIFDGLGYTIDGIIINTSDKGQGLFGIVYGGIIKNVKLGTENTYIVGAASSALVGYLYNGTIYNCTNHSNITSSNSYIGGFAGFAIANSKIEKCFNFGNISSNESGNAIAGIVGQLMNSNVSICLNSGVINGYGNSGGIVGYASSSHINDCINTKSISSTQLSGGICGSIKNSTIISSYNTGDITSISWWAGGITSGVRESGKIENCYSIGNISASQKFSGISQKISTSTLEIKNCYYLENTVNGTNETTITDGVLVKNREDLQNLSTVLGNSFKDDINNINNSYPILNWQ